MFNCRCLINNVILNERRELVFRAGNRGPQQAPVLGLLGWLGAGAARVKSLP